jgi:hypothetical protein
MKMEEKKKKTVFFLKDKPYRRVTAEQYQLQTQGGTNIVIRRRRGKQDRRVCFSKHVASSLKVGDLHHSE